jgi:hypothetical protein
MLLGPKNYFPIARESPERIFLGSQQQFLGVGIARGGLADRVAGSDLAMGRRVIPATPIYFLSDLVYTIYRDA